MSRRVADMIDQPLAGEYGQIVVTGLCADSRKVVAGNAFFAVPGLHVDGADYIDDAIDRGAAVVFIEQRGDVGLQLKNNVPILPIAGLSKKMSAMAAAYYALPERQIDVIGVTGTNGKTTCTHLVASLLGLLGNSAGLIGTLGYGVIGRAGSDLTSTGYTTPDALQTQQCLSELADSGCQVVAMEVSSHATSLYRVESVPFKTAVFTNLSRDHLDFHGDMAAYATAKRRLFESDGLQCAIINIDDAYGRELAGLDLAAGLRLTYSQSDPAADIYAENIHYSLTGIEAGLVTPWGRGVLQTALIGAFNLANVMAAIAVVAVQGYAFEQILQQVAMLRPIVGRMQLVSMPMGNADITVVVDYAHTPQALEMALQALKPHVASELACVFGCGGDRDRGKRAEMGAVAEACADRIVLTSDNPRSENPDQIIGDIHQGITQQERLYVEPDRGAAIAHAIADAGAGDVVLIAGKGHETFQQIGEQKIPFSDYDMAHDELLKRCAA